MSPFLSDSEICRGILESLPAGLCVVDLGKKIVLWSDGAERITGRLRHEVIGHSCISETLLHCDQPGCEFCREDCPVARAMKTSQSAEANGFLHHKAGHEIPVRVRAVPVHNQHGSIVGAVETFEELQPTADSKERGENTALAGCIDEVTSVASQSRMQSHLRETLATFVGFQVPFGVLGIRLEGLQHFRASLGPEAASSLLRVVARSLEGTLWKTDFIGRWSDDQFLAILSGCLEETLPAVRERVRRLLSGDAIEWWGERHSLPVSIGHATAQAGDTVESLMERVQKSLEAASAWRTRSASAAIEMSGS
ncbi:MAG: diguanylate cyclase domain-containing protein [Candidatus Sulfotelmatobacter sp.]